MRLIKGMASVGWFYRLFFLVVGFVTAGLIIWAHAEGVLPSSQQDTSNKGDEIVEMTIVHPDFKTRVRVPLVYLGPRFLGLSKKNRLGGEQSRFLIQFYYPSMLPNTPENAHLKETETLTYASITNTVAGAARRGGLGKTEEARGAWYRYSGKEICGLRELEPTQAFLNNKIYYYKDESIPGDYDVNTKSDNIFSEDIYITCKDRDNSFDENIKCRWRVDTVSNLGITLNAIPKKYICDWPNLTKRLRALTDSFVVGEG